MTRAPINMKSATRLLLVAMIVVLAFGTLSFAQGQRYKTGNQWSFGVHGDTQWTVEGNLADNPNYVSAALARALDKQFIAQGVRFVLQVGDLTDRAGNAALATRAEVAQELFDKGIGFFPLRGNHETYGYLYGNDPLYNLNVPDFKANFPQTQGLANTFGAANFSSPSSTDDILKGLSYSFDYGAPGDNARFVIVDTEMTAVTHNVAPTNVSLTAKVNGSDTPTTITLAQGYFYLGWVVYQYPESIEGKVAFYDETKGPRSDYRAWSAIPGTVPANTWFRISGGMASTNMYGYEEIWPFADWTATVQDAPGGEYWPGKQQSWISAQLDKTTRGTEHAFVFSHRPVINGNHVDSFFGASSAVTPADQNAFYDSLYKNNVKFMISGHDHLYNRAIDKSPDGNSQVMQIISQGASTKFYSPTRLDDFGYDGTAPNQTAVKLRETQISQEVNNFGYYIYTVDGPRVTVDYYSDSVGNFKDGDYYPNGDPNADPPVLGTLEVPNFHFVRQDTWGYSLNGKQFLIPQGTSYMGVADSFEGTETKIIGGKNNSTTSDLTPVGYNTNGELVSGPRPFNKIVNTGWTPKPARDKSVLSNILSLWGMGEFGMDSTDVYVLEMSYVDRRVKGKGKQLGNAGYRLSSLDKNGHWVNAVNLNVGVKNARDQKFIRGPLPRGYKLGNYGIDTEKGTVWAVINYNADFAATQ
jgi:hypothetical protein